MAVHVTVLRVFTDSSGEFGNPLGVVDAGQVPAHDRQSLAAELGYSETIFVDLPASGSATASAHIFTPAVELPFAGHPTVGAAWWLRERGTPVKTLRVPAGVVAVGYENMPDGNFVVVTARPAWSPEFAIHDMASVDDVLAADPDDYTADVSHYLWAWEDREANAIRSRVFARHVGVREDEATGSAAVRITDHLSRDLSITQGRGSQIRTWWSAEGWVKVAGRVAEHEHRHVG